MCVFLEVLTLYNFIFQIYISNYFVFYLKLKRVFKFQIKLKFNFEFEIKHICTGNILALPPAKIRQNVPHPLRTLLVQNL